MRLTDAVTEPLALWVGLAALAGLAFPELAVLRPLTLPVLAVMIGSMGLTLSVDAFREVSRGAFARILALHAVVAVLAFVVARLLQLGPELTLGFVVLGAVTPELTSPVMTHLADGDTALSTSVLVAAGFLSLATVPGWSILLVGDAVPIDPVAMLRPIALAVVLPVAAALWIRHRWSDQVQRHEDAYPAVSALMVIVVMLIVTASNADRILADIGRVALVLVAAVLLQLESWGLGWLGSAGLRGSERRASLLSVGMRDFAVAAGIVLAAGLPGVAALPAVVFGIVEMVAAAGVARLLAG